jgi:hypothetical protein
MRELRHFGTVFLYLALVFGVFALHQFVVLANNGMSYTFYGASPINAAILAKIMHVAEAFHFGEQFEDKPLAFPILNKSVAFGLRRSLQRRALRDEFGVTRVAAKRVAHIIARNEKELRSSAPFDPAVRTEKRIRIVGLDTGPRCGRQVARDPIGNLS